MLEVLPDDAVETMSESALEIIFKNFCNFPVRVNKSLGVSYVGKLS